MFQFNREIVHKHFTHHLQLAKHTKISPNKAGYFPSLKDYYNQIDNHIKPAMGAVRLDSLETHMIQRFYNTLTDKAGKPLSPKTVKNIHGVLHKALQQAIANGYISQNPAAAW